MVVDVADRGWLDATRNRGDTPIVEWSKDDVEARFNALLEVAKGEEAAEETGAKRTKKARAAKETKPHRALDADDLPADHAPNVDWEFVFAPYNALVGCLRAYRNSRAFRHLADPEYSGSSD